MISMLGYTLFDMTLTLKTCIWLDHLVAVCSSLQPNVIYVAAVEKDQLCHEIKNKANHLAGLKHLCFAIIHA